MPDRAILSDQELTGPSADIAARVRAFLPVPSNLSVRFSGQVLQLLLCSANVKRLFVRFCKLCCLFEGPTSKAPRALRQPDWRWGFPMPELHNRAFYLAFRAHCVKTRGLARKNASDSRIFLDLQNLTLTLLGLQRQRPAASTTNLANKAAIPSRTLPRRLTLPARCDTVRAACCFPPGPSASI